MRATNGEERFGWGSASAASLPADREREPAGEGRGRSDLSVDGRMRKCNACVFLELTLIAIKKLFLSIIFIFFSFISARF